MGCADSFGGVSTSMSQSGGAGATGSVPMIFDDGTQGMVPIEKASDAVRDGGKIAQHMHFDDGTTGLVSLNKVHDAMKDGGQLIGAPPAMPRPKMEESLGAPSQAASDIDPGLVGLAASGGEGWMSDEDTANAMTSAGVQVGVSLVGGAVLSKVGTLLKAARAAKLAQMTGEVADDAGPKVKALWPLIKDALSAGEIKGAQAEAVAYKSLGDALYEAQAEATHAAKASHALYYGTLATAAKVLEKASAAWAATGGKVPLLPAAVTLWNAYETAHQIHGIFKSDDDEK